MSKTDYEKLFQPHLQDSYKYHVGLYGRCPFCKRPGFVAHIGSGNWRCKDCGAHGNAKQFEEHITLPMAQSSPPKLEDQDKGQAAGKDKQIPEVQPLDLLSDHPKPLQEPVDYERFCKLYIGPPHRKLPSKTVKERQLKKLSARHCEIIERLLGDQRPRDIAEAFGIGRQWLSVVMNSPVFVDEHRERLAQKAEEIDRQRAERGIDRLERELYFKINLADAVAEATSYMRK